MENMEKGQNVDIYWLKIEVATNKKVILAVGLAGYMFVVECVKRSACTISSDE